MSISQNGSFHDDPYYSSHPDDLERAARLVKAVQKPHWTEAPCSVNVRLPIDGHDVLVTLRGDDEVKVLARLHATLAQFPLTTPPAEPTTPPTPLRVPQPPLEERPDWCTLHGTAMAKQSNASGSWYSHKTSDGWCNGKRRKASA